MKYICKTESSVANHQNNQEMFANISLTSCNSYNANFKLVPPVFTIHDSSLYYEISGVEPPRQPRTQALSTTRLAGGKTLVQAGHVSPRFLEITKFLHKGGG